MKDADAFKIVWGIEEFFQPWNLRDLLDLTYVITESYLSFYSTPLAITRADKVFSCFFLTAKITQHVDRVQGIRHLNGDGLVSGTAADNRAQSSLIGLMA